MKYERLINKLDRIVDAGLISKEDLELHCDGLVTEGDISNLKAHIKMYEEIKGITG